MSGKEYMEDHLSAIIVFLSLLCFTCTLLYAAGMKVSLITCLSALWSGTYSLYMFFCYERVKHHFQEIENLRISLANAYYMGDVLPKAEKIEERFYQYHMKQQTKAMIEEVEAIKREQKEYKEYIEHWVHEMKSISTAMHLLLENHKSLSVGDLRKQLEISEYYVEQVLYYGRSEQVAKDFFIRKTSILNCLENALLDCKYSCRAVNAHIQLPDEDAYVMCDGKWLTFVLKQCIQNSIQYHKPNHPCTLSFMIDEQAEETLLTLQDNGIGVSKSDQKRIFDKGYTGENGRGSNQKATGMGLYICKNLCMQMQVDIQMEAKQQEYCKILLRFPKEDFYHIL